MANRYIRHLRELSKDDVTKSALIMMLFAIIRYGLNEDLTEVSNRYFNYDINIYFFIMEITLIILALYYSSRAFIFNKDHSLKSTITFLFSSALTFLWIYYEFSFFMDRVVLK